MCPYCAENHQADTCTLKSRTTSDCTACARRMKDADASLDLAHLFSTTPLILRHLPLDPTCPARIALAVEKAKKATELRQQQQATGQASKPPTDASVSNPLNAGATNPSTPPAASNSMLEDNDLIIGINEDINLDAAQ